VDTTVKKTIGLCANALLTVAGWMQWLPPLLLRIFLGYLFFESGLPKLENVARFTETFAGWGIPHPYFNVLLTGYTEVIGGLLLIAGLGTRIACVPLIIDMAVATLTVQIKQASGFGDFVALDDPLYVLTFLWLLISGPGAVSLDYFIKRWIGPYFNVTDARLGEIQLPEVGRLSRESGSDSARTSMTF
jgi:putative oxidoreductase